MLSADRFRYKTNLFSYHEMCIQVSISPSGPSRKLRGPFIPLSVSLTPQQRVLCCQHPLKASLPRRLFSREKWSKSEERSPEQLCRLHTIISLHMTRRYFLTGACCCYKPACAGSPERPGRSRGYPRPARGVHHQRHRVSRPRSDPPRSHRQAHPPRVHEVSCGVK